MGLGCVLIWVTDVSEIQPIVQVIKRSLIWPTTRCSHAPPAVCPCYVSNRDLPLPTYSIQKSAVTDTWVPTFLFPPGIDTIHRSTVSVVVWRKIFPPKSLNPSPLQIPPPPPALSATRNAHPSIHLSATDISAPHGSHTQAPLSVHRCRRRPPSVPPPRGPRPPSRRQAPPPEPRLAPAAVLVAGAGGGTDVSPSRRSRGRRGGHVRAVLRAHIEDPHAAMSAEEEADGGEVRGALLAAAVD
jgi:hypothetical protein